MALETITFGAGCFWCVEAVFLAVPGVRSAMSGYMGGGTERPTYEQVCRGDSGHVQVVQVVFDPAEVGIRDLLRVFFLTHDPTQINRQGNDIGTHYRSAIFFHTPEQQRIATEVLQGLQEHIFGQPIATTIEAAPTFYPAEQYHQHYFERNPTQPYCALMIPNKLEKLKKILAKG